MNQYVVSGATLEAPGIVKRNGVCTSTLAFSLGPVQADRSSQVYWLFASHTSGWDPNPNKAFHATVRLLPHTEAAQVDRY